MKVLIENKNTLKVECNDRDILEAIKAHTDGWKVRNENCVLFPVKSGPKIFTFKEYGIEWGEGAEEAVNITAANIDRRKINIQKIRSQYGHDIKFDYDLKGIYPAMDHQKIIFNMMVYNSCSAILAEPGTCKTGPYLWAIDKRIQKGQVKKTLIVTLHHLKQNILAEMEIQVPHLKGVILDNKAQATKVLNKGFKNDKKNIEYDIYLSNYESIYSLCDVINNDYFDCVVLDEAHRIGSPRSRQTKAIIDKFESIKYKYIVTGTLNSNTSLSFFMPFRFLGPDTIPFANYYEFRRKYFFPVDPDQHIWRETSGARHEIRKIIGEISVFFSKDECLDLPGVIYEKYGCDFEGEQAQYYDDIEKNFITEIKDMCEKCNNKDKCDKSCDQFISVKNAISVVTKVRQITCGFYMNTVTKIADDGKETEIKNIITFKTNPKMRLLIETLNNIPSDNKVIIWSDYIHSIDLINKAIQDAGLGKTLLIYKDEDAFQQVEKFKDPQYRYLIANPSKASAGLNIQFSHIQIFYSCDYSLIKRQQAEGRQDRQGQTQKVTIIDLYCRKTIDESILQILRMKEEMSDSLVSVAKLTKLLRGG